MFNLIWQLHGHPSDDLIAINGDVFACICHSVRKHNLIVRYKDNGKILIIQGIGELFLLPRSFILRIR